MEKITYPILQDKLAFGLALSCVLVLSWVENGNTSTLITFSEVQIGTPNPVIADIQFFAGGGESINDTGTDDFWYSGDPYPRNGFNGLFPTPEKYNSFISIIKSRLPLFEKVSFDVELETLLSDSSTLFADAYLGAVKVASDFHEFSATGPNNHASLSLSSLTGFSTIYVYDDLDHSGFGESFHIDNFCFSDMNTNIVPIPTTILLLGTGIAILVGTRNNRKGKTAE